MQEIQERPCGATGETIVQTALAAGFPKNQSVACEARHAPTGLRAGRAPCAHARPAFCVAYLCDSLWFFMFFVISKTRGSPAGGSRPLIGSNLRNRRFPILAVFVTLCVLCGSRAA